MVDRVDMNMQAFGVLAHAVGDTARRLAGVATDGYQPARTVIESGPSFVNAATEPVVAFSRPLPEVTPEPGREADQASERAWWQPFLGGDMNIARETAGLLAFETAFKARAQAVRTIEQATGSLCDRLA